VKQRRQNSTRLDQKIFNRLRGTSITFWITIIIPKIVENLLNDSNEKDIEKCQMKTFEIFLAFLYLESQGKDPF
jgi:hypothetical protein